MIVPTSRWLWAALALALLAPLSLLWPVAAGWWLGLSLLWVAAAVIDGIRVSAFDPGTLRIEWDGPTALSVDRPLPVRLRLQSTARPVTVWVRETVPPALAPLPDRIVTLRPGRELIEERFLVARSVGRAGRWRLDLRIAGPWGLVWRQSRREPGWEVTIYPRLEQAALAQLPAQARLRREAGLRQVRRRGEGRLFESLREWVPGDELRTVDWKASARRGKLIARQYEDERRQRVMIALDAGRLLTAESDGRARLEDAIEAIAQLAYRTAAVDDDVGLLVFSDEIDHFLAPLRGKAAIRPILEILAVTEGRLVEPDYPRAFAFLASQTRKRALTIVFSDVIDRFASDALVAQLGRLRPRHLPVVVAIRDVALERLAGTRPDDAAGAFERAAAEQMLQVRADALADLRARGVVVVDAHPDAVAKSVVDCYLQLKRRALI